MSGRVGPFRERDENDLQIVRVRFQRSVRSYAYAVSKDLGSLEIGDTAWTPGNPVSPYGAPAKVVGFGSDYAGELAVIKRLADPTEHYTYNTEQARYETEGDYE